MKNHKYCWFSSGIVIAGLGVSCFSSPVYAQYNALECNVTDTDSVLYETSDDGLMIKDTGQETSVSENSAENESAIPQIVSDPSQPEYSNKSFGNAIIDMDSDGTTDNNDIAAFLELVKDYDVSEHGNQEMPGELTKIIYGDIRSSGQTDTPEYTEYYLNNTGQATSVKDQLSFGTCWTFASVAGLESSILKQRQALNGEDVTRASEGDPMLSGISDTVDISEKYTAWTVYDKDYRDPSQDEGLTSKKEGQYVLDTGGWTGAVDKYWTSWRGVVDEEAEPYRADDASDIYTEQFQGDWSLSGNIYPVGDENAPARVNNTYLLPSPAIIEYKDGNNTWTGYDAGATDLIKQTLVETGAVAISYKVDQSRIGESGNREFLNTKNWSQYIDSDIVKTNHGVVIVGWNDNYPAENFLADSNSLPPGDGAWLVKNSWGSYDYYEKHYGDSFTELDEERKRADTWGIRDENGMGTGYFWLSYYDKSIASAIAFEADIPEDGWDHDRIYQYDMYNDASVNTFVLRMYDTGTTVANVFTSGENERLEAVSVRISEPCSRVNVKVYLLDSDKDISDPSSGELVSELDTKVDLAGFKTLDLDEPVILKPGQRFAVTETIVADCGYENSSVSFLNVETIIDESLQNNNNMSLARSSVYAGAGESFAKVLNNGAYVWMTPDMLTNAIGGGVFTFGNALIKAYTTMIDTQDNGDNKPDEPGKNEEGDQNTTKTAEDLNQKNTDSNEEIKAADNIKTDIEINDPGDMKNDLSNKKGTIADSGKISSVNTVAAKSGVDVQAVSAHNSNAIQVVSANTGVKNNTYVWRTAMITSAGALGFVSLLLTVKKKGTRAIDKKINLTKKQL